MSTDEHKPWVPTDRHIRDDYAEIEEGTSPYRQAAFDRWLAAHDARVRRDAAREALDGLIGALNTSVHEIQNGPTPNPVAWQTGALWTRDLAKIHRDTHYPEETP